MPPSDLTAEHIEQISRIAVAPLERLMTERMDRMERLITDHSSAQDVRLAQLEQRVSALEGIKIKLFGVASLVGLLASVAWALLKDWFVRTFLR